LVLVVPHFVQFPLHSQKAWGVPALPRGDGSKGSCILEGQKGHAPAGVSRTMSVIRCRHRSQYCVIRRGQRSIWLIMVHLCREMPISSMAAKAHTCLSPTLICLYSRARRTTAPETWRVKTKSQEHHTTGNLFTYELTYKWVCGARETYTDTLGLDV